MDEVSGPLRNSKRTFPGMLRLVHESVAADLAEDHRVFLKLIFYSYKNNLL